MTWNNRVIKRTVKDPVFGELVSYTLAEVYYQDDEIVGFVEYEELGAPSRKELLHLLETMVKDVRNPEKKTLKYEELPDGTVHGKT